MIAHIIPNCWFNSVIVPTLRLSHMVLNTDETPTVRYVLQSSLRRLQTADGDCRWLPAGGSVIMMKLYCNSRLQWLNKRLEPWGAKWSQMTLTILTWWSISIPKKFWGGMKTQRREKLRSTRTLEYLKSSSIFSVDLGLGFLFLTFYHFSCNNFRALLTLSFMWSALREGWS